MTVHVVPRNDERQHAHSLECWCKPRVDWVDPDNGQPWPRGGPRVLHHAADCRETCEELTGEALSPDHTWELVEIE
jgi:hypothetical protein